MITPSHSQLRRCTTRFLFVGLLAAGCTTGCESTSVRNSHLSVYDHESAVALNAELMRLLDDAQTTDQELTVLLQARRIQMLRLAAHQPRSFLLRALPDEVVQRVPLSLRPLVEQRIETEGYLLSIHHDDFQRHRETVSYQLHESLDRKFEPAREVHFVQPPDEKSSQRRVRVHGLALDNQLVVSGPADLTHDALVRKAGEPVVQVVAGDMRVGVLKISFEGEPGIPCSDSVLGETLFDGPDSTAKFFRTNSFGKLNMIPGPRGALVGDVTIAKLAGETCADEVWAKRAAEQLGGEDQVWAGYDIRAFVFAPQEGCNLAAATMGGWEPGGAPALAWFFAGEACPPADVYAHEFGHTLGLDHASEIQMDGTELSYGDLSCVMGYSAWPLRCLNAPHSIQLGWLPEGTLRTVESSGDYAIESLPADPTSAVKALRIPSPTSSDATSSLYVSYRTAISCDTTLEDQYKYKVSIHRWPGHGETWLLKTLTPGDRFEDASGVSIENKSTSNTAEVAQVYVTIPGTVDSGDAGGVGGSTDGGGGNGSTDGGGGNGDVGGTDGGGDHEPSPGVGGDASRPDHDRGDAGTYGGGYGPITGGCTLHAAPPSVGGHPWWVLIAVSLGCSGRRRARSRK